jgi:hypothetical protein
MGYTVHQLLCKSVAGVHQGLNFWRIFAPRLVALV